MPEQRTTQTPPNFSGRHGQTARFLAEKPVFHNLKGTLKRLGQYLSAKWPVLLLVFLAAVLTTVITIIGTRLNGYAVDHFILQGDIASLGRICLIMAGMYLVGAAASYMQNILMIRVFQRTAADIRRDLFKRVQRLPLSYFDTHSSGDLMSRLTNDVDNINTALSQAVVQLFADVVSILGMLAAMLFLSPLLTVICLVATAATYFTSNMIVRMGQRFFIVQQKELGTLNGYIEEMVSGQNIMIPRLKTQKLEK
jgi:ATP-binding cassette subfamily B protein